LIKNKFFTDLSYRLGSCSFGIYLIHIIFIQFLEAILAKFIPILTENVTIASILILSICSFLISWVIVEKLFLKSNVLRLTISN
jgi:peptidoglycan/LPS O-acetylase OafA/YrhL